MKRGPKTLSERLPNDPRFESENVKALRGVRNGMLARCYEKSCVSYKRYGKRGIRVCRRWKHSLVAFIEDMGVRPAGTSLDRIDNDGPYCPTNYRWATREMQANNTSISRQWHYNGRFQSVAAWARETGVERWVLARLLKHGMPIADAIARASAQRELLEKQCAASPIVRAIVQKEFEFRRSREKAAEERRIKRAEDRKAEKARARTVHNYSTPTGTSK